MNKREGTYSHASSERISRSRVAIATHGPFFSSLLHAMTLGKVSILCNLWKDILLNKIARIEVSFGKKHSFSIRDVFPGKL